MIKKWMQRLTAAAGLATLGLVAPPAQAQATPLVRIICGYAPGGNVDVLARLFAQSLSEALGRTVIVENKPGAGGQTAAELLKASAPDGNTLMLAPDAAAVVRPAAMKRPTYNANEDFVAVAETGAQDYGFAVSTHIPVKNLAEFVAWARANPLKANYGSAGAGGITHMASILIGQALNAPMQHVPYNGSAPAVNALMGGHIAATFQPIGTLVTQAKAGMVRIIAVSGPKRSELFPDVPTFTELGHPSLELVSWFGIFAPAKTPKTIVDQYNNVIVQATRKPAMKTQLRSLGLDVRELTPEAFGATVKNDMERWTTVIKASGFSLDSE